MTPRAEINTARTTLRSFVIADAAAIVEAMSDWEVMRWLSAPPYPYGLEDAHYFIREIAHEDHWAIEIDGECAGAIGINPDLGFWLARKFWARGYMSEVVRAVVADHFADPDAGTLISGYFISNDASWGVQKPLGFELTQVERTFARPLGKDVDLQRTQLTRDAYARANPFRIDTPRLILATPDPEADLAAFIDIVGRYPVARMLGGFTHPFPGPVARERLEKGQWHGHIGFGLGLYLRDTGQFIGTVGIGGDPASTGYALHPDHWGKGYMREALGAFLARCFVHFGMDYITADHFADNPASGRVMCALGFEKCGEGLGRSKARLEPAPVIQYRLDRNNLKA